MGPKVPMVAEGLTAEGPTVEGPTVAAPTRVGQGITTAKMSAAASIV